MNVTSIVPALIFLIGEPTIETSAPVGTLFNKLVRLLFNNVDDLLKIVESLEMHLKNEADVRKILRRSFEVLEEYPAELIKGIADMQEFKYTKSDAQFKVMSMVAKGNKMAERILSKGGNV